MRPKAFFSVGSVAVCALTNGCGNAGQCGGFEPGAGGGPAGPGQGGYGDAPGPTPQDASDYPSEGCGASQAACETKCVQGREADVAKCDDLTDNTQRTTCAEAAQARYAGCHHGCFAQNDDAEELANRVVCAIPGSNACVDKCATIGAYCANLAVHPFSPSSGTGSLYSCAVDGAKESCSFHYDNNDICWRTKDGFRPPKWKCLYAHP